MNIVKHEMIATPTRILSPLKWTKMVSPECDISDLLNHAWLIIPIEHTDNDVKVTITFKNREPETCKLRIALFQWMYVVSENHNSVHPDFFENKDDFCATAVGHVKETPIILGGIVPVSMHVACPMITFSFLAQISFPPK
jgi:hypothetical protein